MNRDAAHPHRATADIAIAKRPIDLMWPPSPRLSAVGCRLSALQIPGPFAAITGILTLGPSSTVMRSRP
jgi:hypothetical protein